MTWTIAGRTAAGLLLTLALGGCGAPVRARERAAVPLTVSPPATAQADSGGPSYTAADGQFMSDMIRHHAQAVLIAGWASTHGASQAVRVLSERIVVGQQDERTLMARWLRERGETRPGTEHSGTAHSTPMPGMLSTEQLAQLDRARGPEFDRLFLTLMIVHHQGALTMVDRLFGTQGAAQDETVFRLASDVSAEQLAEIDRMQKMLAALPPQRSGP